MEYLGLWVTQNGIRLINRKVEAMVKMIPPTKQKQVHEFIGLGNYYRDMWDIRSNLLHPLTALTPNKLNFKWTVVGQIAFYDIKRIVNCDTLLAYTDFNE